MLIGNHFHLIAQVARAALSVDLKSALKREEPVLSGDVSSIPPVYPTQAPRVSE